MTDKPKFPNSLFLPPEAFDGYSKYLNIYGKNHVCDGDDFIEYVRKNATLDVHLEFANTGDFGLKNSYLNQLAHKAFVACETSKIEFPQPNFVALKLAEEAGEIIRAGVHFAEGRMEWSEVEVEAVQAIGTIFRLLTEGDEVNGIIPPKIKGDKL